ncbi:EDS1 [Hirschfeldia incana]|nr:EDS1 [Hirschfeldia incana]
MINELLRRVSKEKERGLQTLPKVEEWISMAEETESKATSLLDESISKCHDLSTYDDCSKVSESILHYSEMVCMTMKEVKALRSKGVFKVLVEGAPLSYVKKMLPLKPIVSREMLPEEAWDYFQEIVGETTLKSHPDIPQLARILCRKCRGFPIALSLVGETMSRKRTVREWHHAIHVLVSSTTDFSGTEAELLPILKFTYDNLHGENIRSCFLYCALFPKSCDISKQDLVDCWIAEGKIEEEEDREIAKIKGYEVIADLVMLRLLTDDESGYGVTMHGIVREMALWIATDCGRQKENFVVVSGEDIHQIPEVDDWSNVRRMSVTSTQVHKISDSHDCPELTTLFLQENNLKWVSGDFFRWMTSLAVLNLSPNRELSELPEEVSSLVSLRLLKLSWTNIKRLPLGLKELKRLIHLDLDYTSLLREVDVIGYLLKLQVLRLLRSVPMDLSLMVNIELLKSLKELSITVREVDVLKRLQSIHQLACCIRHLHLTGITIKDGGTLLLNSVLSLRKLDIQMCDIPEIIINWRSTIQRETIHFGNIQKIPHLQNIRTVALSWCKGLKDLTWLLVAPNLDDLSLLDCQQIEQIIKKEKATADMSEEPFQNLTRLNLDSLPRLESIYWTPLPFPFLKYLCIRGCPKLRRLPFNSKSAKGNQVRSDIEQEWIKGAEWEDEATKQRFSYFFDRDFSTMADDQKMKGLVSESQPIEEIVLVETLEIGKGTTTNSNTGENVFQSGTHATTEHKHTYRVLTPDSTIDSLTDTPEHDSMKECWFETKQLQASYMEECRFETSELQASFMMSTPLWSNSWNLCNAADSARNIQIQHVAGIMYVALPKVEMNQVGDLVGVEVGGDGLFSALSSSLPSGEPPLMVNGAIHKLFVSSCRLIQSQISQGLELDETKQVVITGHSTGGALAALTTLWVLSQPSPPPFRLLCITFGSPLLGNQSFSSSVSQSRLAHKFCHVVSVHDHVPRGNDDRFWPFGTYLFCSDSGGLCLDNADSVRGMFRILNSTGTPDIEEHQRYKHYVSTFSHQFLLSRSFRGGCIPENSYEAGAALAVESLGFSYDKKSGMSVKECIEAATKKSRAQILRSSELASELGNVLPCKLDIQWYKDSCEESPKQRGYYDNFKLKSNPRELKVNMSRAKLAKFWDSVFEMVEKNELPFDFHLGKKWVYASHFYQLLTEPLDIAYFYKYKYSRMMGHYMESRNRPKRYVVIDNWWEESGEPHKKRARTRYPSTTQDTCFWAKLEEAKECLDYLSCKTSDVQNKTLWEKIVGFESYADALVKMKEVSKDVLAKNSSYNVRVEKLREFKLKMGNGVVDESDAMET